MKGARFLMLTKMTKLFVLFISKQTKLFSYIRQAYDPCLRHGDELCSLRSCSTGSSACQGLRPRTPGCLIIAKCLYLILKNTSVKHKYFSSIITSGYTMFLVTGCANLGSHIALML